MSAVPSSAVPRLDAGAAPPSRRTVAVLALFAGAGAVLGLVVGGVASGLVGALVGLVVAAALATGVLWTRAGRFRLLPAVAAPADRLRHARYFNVVDGLCVAAGVRVPTLRIVPGPGLNVAVSGREAAAAALTVTEPLLEALTRIELEGVLAVALASLRRGDTRPATLAAAGGGLGVGLAVGAGRDRLVDETAAAITRYPPGLMAAYAKMQDAGTTVASSTRADQHLWVADPGPPGQPSRPYRTPLRDRIAALAEL